MPTLCILILQLICYGRFTALTCCRFPLSFNGKIPCTRKLIQDSIAVICRIFNITCIILIYSFISAQTCDPFFCGIYIGNTESVILRQILECNLINIYQLIIRTCYFSTRTSVKRYNIYRFCTLRQCINLMRSALFIIIVPLIVIIIIYLPVSTDIPSVIFGLNNRRACRLGFLVLSFIITGSISITPENNISRVSCFTCSFSDFLCILPLDINTKVHTARYNIFKCTVLVYLVNLG